jgi:lipoate-protein ligase A
MGLAAELAEHNLEAEPGCCFTAPVQFDVLWQHSKIAGAAQRRNRFGLLIQGSVQPPLELDRSAWTQALLEAARQLWNTEPTPWKAPATLHTRCAELVAAKYARPEYNQRR